MENITEKQLFESAYFVSKIQEQNILVKDITDKINSLFCRGGIICYTNKENVLDRNEELENALRVAQKMLNIAMIRADDAVKYYMNKQ